MNVDINKWVNLETCPLDSIDFANQCRQKLSEEGVLLIPQFLQSEALKQTIKEAEAQTHLAYFTKKTHNVYLSEPDASLPETHVFNRQVKSSKGCITTDQIQKESGLHIIYNNFIFKKFIAHVVRENAIYPYADTLSGINIHYASEGEELGWHFDNSSFAITLMINDVSAGGEFEYTQPIRGKTVEKEKEFKNVSMVLNNKFKTTKVAMKPGGLLLFNGKNSMHRVTKVKSNETRILAVLAYNDKPGVSLSTSAQMTFYGKSEN